MALPRALVALAALLAVASLATAGAVLPAIAPGTEGPPDSTAPAPTDTPGSRSGGGSGGSAGDGEEATAVDGTTPTPTNGTARGDVPVGRVAVLALGALCLGALALFVGLRDDGGTVPPAAATADEPAAVGDVPPPSPGNGVASAWYRMVDRLDVADREARTPAELAARAVDAGMDPDAVRELTDLFRAVRYGDERPTPAAERRADRALERLEGR